MYMIMMCNQNTDVENYRGLDNNLDTEKEARTIVRLYFQFFVTKK